MTEPGGFAYLRHGVGVGAVHDSGWRWAEGGVGGHDLGGIRDIVPGIRASHEGSGSNDGG